MIRAPLFLALPLAENVCRDANFGGTCDSSVFEPTSGQATLCLGDICGGGESAPPPPPPKKTTPPKKPKQNEDPPSRPQDPPSRPVREEQKVKPVDPPKKDLPPDLSPPDTSPPPPVNDIPPPPPPPPPPGVPPPPILPQPTTAPTNTGFSIDIDFGKIFSVLGKLLSFGGAFNGEVAWGAYNASGVVRLGGFGRAGVGHVFNPKNWLLSVHCSYAGLFIQRFGEEKLDPETKKSSPDQKIDFSHGFLCGGGIGRRFKSQYFLAHIEGGGVFRESTLDSPENRAGVYKTGLLYSPFGGDFYFDVSALFFTNTLNSTDKSKPDPSILFGIQWIL